MLQAEQVLQERYQLKQKLGQNAGRQTWLAEDLQVAPPEPVIIKLLTFGGDVQWDDLKLFEREAQVLKQLNHPRIPKYRDSFSIDDRTLWFGLVQSYIPGHSLKDLLTQGKKFTEVEVRKIAVAVLQILIYLHKLNPPVLHRDIKPSNLIWGEDQNIYLVDFGAVQDRAAAEGATFTVVGTYGYAPMEQFGGRTVPASDLYALGATLVHLLTGIAPADLPQSDLTIEFRDRTNASSHLLRWIEELIEPSLKRRFSQAQQALNALKSGHLSRTGSCKISPPPNTRVNLRKSREQLIVELPLTQRSPLKKLGLWLKLAAVGLIGAVSLFSFCMAIAYSLFSPGGGLVFNLVVALAGSGLVFNFLQTTFGRERIVINEQEFLIQKLLFDRCIHQRKGASSEIKDVFQSLQIEASGTFDTTYSRAKEIITIQTTTQRYSFGLGLSSGECLWIAQEIKSWLRMERS